MEMVKATWPLPISSLMEDFHIGYRLEPGLCTVERMARQGLP